MSEIEKPNFNEPHALDSFNRSDWQATVNYAEAWAQDESFSARPRLLASAISTTFLSDPLRSEKIARDGLGTNPGHPGLINNIAFALIAQGKPVEALQTVNNIDRALVTPNEAICLMATVGQAYFRLGEQEKGRQFYNEAMHVAFRHRKEPLRSLARLYLAIASTEC